MTPTELRTLDAWINEHVFSGEGTESECYVNWHSLDEDYCITCGVMAENGDRIPKKFSTDISASFEVVAKIKTMMFSVRHRFARELEKRIVVEGYQIAWPEALFFLKPEDICLAIKSAMEGEKNA